MDGLAYAIDPASGGWRWRVFDPDGELIADGTAPSQGEARAAAFTLLRHRPQQPFPA